MPVATLTFNIPEERQEFEMACKGSEWQGVVFDVDKYLRDKLKYGKLSTGASDTLEDFRTYLRGCLEERKLSLD